MSLASVGFCNALVLLDTPVAFIYFCNAWVLGNRGHTHDWGRAAPYKLPCLLCFSFFVLQIKVAMGERLEPATRAALGLG